MLQLIQAALVSQIFGGFWIAALEAWEIGGVAFAFVVVILGVSYLLEKWGVGLHA